MNFYDVDTFEAQNSILFFIKKNKQNVCNRATIWKFDCLHKWRRSYNCVYIVLVLNTERKECAGVGDVWMILR